MGVTGGRGGSAVAGAALAGAGDAAAVTDRSRQTGGALGVAILGSVFSVLYSNGLGSLADRLPPPVAAAVDDGIGNALRAATTLPPDQARSVVSTAQRAFTDAIGTTALLAAGAVLIGAVVALAWLPARPDRPRTSGDGSSAGVAREPDAAGAHTSVVRGPHAVDERVGENVGGEHAIGGHGSGRDRHE
jgi:hypothetical protein